MRAKSPFQKGSNPNPKPEHYAKLFGEEEGGVFYKYNFQLFEKF
jgi:hypothetical protein